MMFAKLWLLIIVSGASYNQGNVQVIGFKDLAQCEAVKNAMPKNYMDMRCVETNNVVLK